MCLSLGSNQFLSAVAGATSNGTCEVELQPDNAQPADCSLECFTLVDIAGVNRS
jgi:hypothetical protein